MAEKYTPTSSSPQALPRRRGRQVKADRRSETLFSIPPSVNTKLLDLDSGRCLITGQKKPAASLQVAHLFGRKTRIRNSNLVFNEYQTEPESLLRECKGMWNVPKINIHTTENLVTLKSDWRMAFDNGDWALVPTVEILQEILYFEDSSFNTPYPGYDPAVPQPYIFAPFPTLGLRYIFRQNKAFTEDRQPDDGDMGEEEYSGESEGGKDGRGGQGGQGEGGERGEKIDGNVYGSASVGQDEMDKQVPKTAAHNETAPGDDNDGEGEQVWDIDNGDFSIYSYPFTKFPLLRHHSHPFYVIVDAVPKLQAQVTPFMGPLSDQMLQSLHIMEWIMHRWHEPQRLATMASNNRRRPRNNQTHDDSDVRTNDKPTDEPKRNADGTGGDTDTGGRVEGKKRKRT